MNSWSSFVDFLLKLKMEIFLLNHRNKWKTLATLCLFILIHYFNCDFRFILERCYWINEIYHLLWSIFILWNLNRIFNVYVYVCMFVHWPKIIQIQKKIKFIFNYLWNEEFLWRAIKKCLWNNRSAIFMNNKIIISIENSGDYFVM